MSDTIPGGGPAPPAPNANPECPNNPDYSLCRVTRVATVQQPMIAWEPIYNGSGMMINSDPNTHISTFSCSVCDMNWETSQVAGQQMVFHKLPASRKG